MELVDLHNHALYACDDGPKSEKDMQSLIDAIYKDSIRHLCLTPHYHPGYFGENSERADRSFEKLSRYAAEKYPDLKLYRGNELRYDRGCVEWIKSGRCHAINDTNYVLVDFSHSAEGDEIVKGTNSILSAGYIPVLAHVERYRKVAKDMDFVRELRENGVVIQVDAQSILGVFGFGSKRCCKRMLALGLVDLVATDAHGSVIRPPSISDSYKYIEKHFGHRYAEAVCIHNPYAILQNRQPGKE
ncbi:MAG: hypothetical protein IKT46_03090 [Clostridia bacterium]|nr:hypothetical protein [Clostridia bacterium]